MLSQAAVEKAMRLSSRHLYILSTLLILASWFLARNALMLFSLSFAFLIVVSKCNVKERLVSKIVKQILSSSTSSMLLPFRLISILLKGLGADGGLKNISSSWLKKCQYYLQHTIPKRDWFDSAATSSLLCDSHLYLSSINSPWRLSSLQSDLAE